MHPLQSHPQGGWTPGAVLMAQLVHLEVGKTVAVSVSRSHRPSRVRRTQPLPEWHRHGRAIRRGTARWPPEGGSGEGIKGGSSGQASVSLFACGNLFCKQNLIYHSCALWG